MNVATPLDAVWPVPPEQLSVAPPGLPVSASAMCVELSPVTTCRVESSTATFTVNGAAAAMLAPETGCAVSASSEAAGAEPPEPPPVLPLEPPPDGVEPDPEPAEGAGSEDDVPGPVEGVPPLGDVPDEPFDPPDEPFDPPGEPGECGEPEAAFDVVVLVDETAVRCVPGPKDAGEDVARGFGACRLALRPGRRATSPLGRCGA